MKFSRRTLLIIVVVVVALLVGCGKASDDTRDPTVTPPLPTPEPSPTPEPEATPTEGQNPWRTVDAPDAVSAGRTDCPTEWVVFIDPEDRYSICYPADFTVTASAVALNAHSPGALDGVDGAVSVIIGIGPGSGYGLGPPSLDTCSKYTSIVEGPNSSAFVELEIGAGVVPACLTVGGLSSSLHGAIQISSDGSNSGRFVRFIVAFAGPDRSEVPELGQTVLDTLRVNFR